MDVQSAWRRGALSLAALVAVSLIAATASGGAGKPVLSFTSGVLGAAGNCASQNSAKGFNFWEFPLTNDTMIRQRPDGKFVPGLAASWRYVHDSAGPNKSFELTLRRGLRFSDGTPLTAKAEKTWILYHKTANSPFVGQLGPIRSVDAIGRYVVRVHLASPNPYLPYWFTKSWGAPSSPAAVAKSVADQSRDYLASHTAGTGPYVLDPSQSVTGDHCTYVPNKYFPNKAAIRWSKVVSKNIVDPNSALAALRSGQLTIIAADSSVADAAASSGLQVVPGWGAANIVGLWYFDRGSLCPPLGDVRVRQALNYAIDRKAISSALFGKWAIPTSDPTWGTAGGGLKKYRNYYPYNPSKAKSLLAAAGFSNGFTFSVLALPAGNANLPLAQTIAKYLGAVGVKLDITTAAADYVTKLFSRNYCAIMAGPGGTGFTMYFLYTLGLSPTGVFNQHGWHDPVLDQLWVKGARAKQGQADKYWNQMAARLVTQGDFLPVALYPGYFVYASKKVGGIHANGPVASPIDWFLK
jgi:peptide/nickel transport system substrate-binding protein